MTNAMKQILTISLGLIWANLLFAQVQYVQDTSICNSLFLDYSTPEQILSIAPDMSFPDDSEDYVSIDTAYRCKLAVIYDPYDLYISKDSQEYMLAVLYYGMFRTSYRAFYVGRLKDNGMARNTHSYVMTTLSDFHTESGIHIGMSLDEVIALKGNDYIFDGECYTYYWISEYTRQHNPDNLMSYFEETNTGEMFLQFAVSEGKIVWYAIGTVQL